MKSLKALGSELAFPLVQLEHIDQAETLPRFENKLVEIGLYPLTPTHIEILQVNVGKMCNQTCHHCHVDAGPDRTEIMELETMKYCLDAIQRSEIHTVDITGGAPEMNPQFEWFLRRVSDLERRILVRSNLTILTKNQYRHFPKLFADSRVTVIASLPCYTSSNTDSQRGQGVFEDSIQALRALNSLGYGRLDSGLELHLVYNPLGASLPAPQAKLQADYKRVLKENFDVVFNELYCITNMPISRFLDYLLRSGRYDSYMETLVNAFNPSAAAGVMCRNTLSVGWDGMLYDCDFNQMLELGLDSGAPRHIAEFDTRKLESRRIVLNQHCYACTAGAGSSCGGEISCRGD
jgi:radical SAM/Cys-rich protein